MTPIKTWQQRNREPTIGANRRLTFFIINTPHFYSTCRCRDSRKEGVLDVVFRNNYRWWLISVQVLSDGEAVCMSALWKFTSTTNVEKGSDKEQAFLPRWDELCPGACCVLSFGKPANELLTWRPRPLIPICCTVVLLFFSPASWAPQIQ